MTNYIWSAQDLSTVVYSMFAELQRYFVLPQTWVDFNYADRPPRDNQKWRGGAQVLQRPAEDDGNVQPVEQKAQERPFHSTTT